MLMAMNSRKVCALVFLDLFAPFDNIDHTNLFDRLSIFDSINDAMFDSINDAKSNDLLSLML